MSVTFATASADRETKQGLSEHSGFFLLAHEKEDAAATDARQHLSSDEQLIIFYFIRFNSLVGPELILDGSQFLFYVSRHTDYVNFIKTIPFN